MRQHRGPIDTLASNTTRAAALGILALLGCDRDEKSSGGHAPTEIASAPASTTSPRGAVPTPEFEFVTAPHGASLFWLEQGDVKSSIIELRLDRLGNPITAPAARVQITGDAAVSDLAATWAGGQLYLAWLQQTRGDAGVWLFTSSTGERTRLADAWPAPPHARRNLSLVPRRNQGLLMTRGPAHACADDPAKSCHGFDFYRLDGAEVQSSGVPLDVPVPCDSASAHALSLGERWHYAVCTQQAGRDVTTVFNITPKPEYAEAYTALEGCRPMGLTHWAGGAWLIGDCPDGKRAVSLARQGSEGIRLGFAQLNCSGDRALVKAGSFRLQLEEPRERTELLLEAPDSAVRSLWTGQIHLRAEPRSQRPAVSSQRCRDGSLRQAQLPAVDAPAHGSNPPTFAE